MKRQEIFKDILGYEGIYQVSNLGKVKSLKFGKEKILKPSLASNGYLIVNFCKDGKHKVFQVHQLVAIAFLNHTPCGHELVIDHVNNNPLDNRLENLQIVTHRKNSSKDRADGSSKYMGVCWSKAREKWLASIRINGKSKHLGYFEDEIDASDRYQQELKKIS